MIASVTQAAGVTAAPPSNAAASSDAPASLLPSPADIPSDPLLMLSYCESRNGQFATSDGQKAIEGQDKTREKALKDLHAAIQAEVYAAQNKSFWDQLGNVFGEVAKAAAVVASIAAAVATCGAGSPLAALAVSGAVLSTAGFADGELHVLKQLGVSDQTAGIIDIALSAGGAGASITAAGLANVSSVVERTASVVGGVGAVGAAAGGLGSGLAQASGDRAVADELSAEAQQQAMDRLTTRTLEVMKDASDQTTAAMQTIAKTENIKTDTGMAVATALQGVGA